MAPDDKRRAATLGRVWKDIVDQQDAPWEQMAGKAAVIIPGGLLAVAAVNEQQPQGDAPVHGQLGIAGHDGNDRFFEAGTSQIPAQLGQGIHLAQPGIPQVWIVKLLARLVFLGAAVMVNGKEHIAGVLAAGAQVDG